MKIKLSIATATILLTTFAFASNTDEQIKQLNNRIAQLEKSSTQQQTQTDTLTDEIVNLQNGVSFDSLDVNKSQTGLGVAASKVYYSKNPLSIGGYGEMFYTANKTSFPNTPTSSSTYMANSEILRFVPYIGYKFSDTVILNSEIEFEHGGAEVAIEQLYLDFMLKENMNLRVGNQIVPMGLVNINHEPVLFNTVFRPDTEKFIIPSTWHEDAIMINGKTSNITYIGGVIAALNMGLAEHDGGIDDGGYGAEWIRYGRRGGNEINSQVSNLGVVARIDYTGHTGLIAGFSGYIGKAGPKNTEITTDNGMMTILDAHIQYQYNGFKLRGLYAMANLTNASAYTGRHAIGDTTVLFPYHPSSARGGYINLEYNILPHFVKTNKRLPVFIQYESYNMGNKVEAGSPTNGGMIVAPFGNSVNYSFGANFFPTDQVVVKAEYETKRNKNTPTNVDYFNENIFNLGLGFIF